MANWSKTANNVFIMAPPDVFSKKESKAFYNENDPTGTKLNEQGKIKIMEQIESHFITYEKQQYSLKYKKKLNK